MCVQRYASSHFDTKTVAYILKKILHIITVEQNKFLSVISGWKVSDTITNVLKQHGITNLIKGTKSPESNPFSDNEQKQSEKGSSMFLDNYIIQDYLDVFLLIGNSEMSQNFIFLFQNFA